MELGIPDIKSYAKSVANNYVKSTENESLFKFYDFADGSFSKEDYNNSLLLVSAEILKICDKNKDETVSTEEFKDWLHRYFATDIVKHFFNKVEQSYESMMVSARASDLIANEISHADAKLNGDKSSVSVEEIFTILKTLDKSGYPDNDKEGNTVFIKDDNELGEISKTEFLGLFDFFTKGGSSNYPAVQKYIKKGTLKEKDENELKKLLFDSIKFITEQAENLNIDLGLNTQYSQFEQ